MTNWKKTLERAEPFIDFLKSGDFFSMPYHGSIEALVLTNPKIALNYCLSENFADFSSWDNLKDQLPKNHKIYPFVHEKIREVDYWGYENGDFHGALEKMTVNGIGILQDQMYGDVFSIIDFYANNSFPSIWEKILHVYFHDGFPCGWDGDLESGRIVVFSNY